MTTARLLLGIRLIARTLSLCLLAALPAHHVSADDLVVVVSARSNIDALTRQQVKDIYLGAQSSFPNGLKAIPIDQVDGSAQRDQFHSLVTGKTRHQLRAHWARKVFSGKGTPPRESDNPAEIREWIAAVRGASAISAGIRLMQCSRWSLCHDTDAGPVSSYRFPPAKHRPLATLQH